ncbi:hypothetical protein VTL71DRAFT_6187 [Oculimacula yallundae]|uniref:F-box domain-containing protein n=1 Tax=Oculimacula yallundae TaxID=86028 RepID=A0ABR4BZM8_9HELO
MATESENSSSSTNFLIYTLNDQQNTNSEPNERSESIILSLPSEIRGQIISNVIFNNEIEIMDPYPHYVDKNGSYKPYILESTMLVCRKFHTHVKDLLAMPEHQNLQQISFAGLFNPETTVWKVDHANIKSPWNHTNRRHFDRARYNPAFEANVQIVKIDMSFDPSIGETEESIFSFFMPLANPWFNLLYGLNHLKRIDLLVHGKLSTKSKMNIIKAIWWSLDFCDRDVNCNCCVGPRVRWKNVNRVKGRWRDIQLWTPREASRYEKWRSKRLDQQAAMLMENWEPSIQDTVEGEELETQEDTDQYSAEDDESDAGDILEDIDYSLLDKLKGRTIFV